MSKALSLDLRERVLAAVACGASCRKAAERFGVSVSSAIRWRVLERKQGTATPGPLGGDRRSGRIEAQAAAILALYEACRDITLEEIRTELMEKGHVFSVSMIWRFFARRGITFKKRLHMRQSRTDRMS